MNELIEIPIKLNKNGYFEIWTLESVDYFQKVEIKKSYINCMPLYKWKYAHEYLLKNNKVDLHFPCFLREIEHFWTGVDDLIKLDFLKDYEQKKLITLFKRKINAEVKMSKKNGWNSIWMGFKHESFLKTVNEINEEKKPKIKNLKTKVYLMFDSNTGYYKIGRSVKPRIREKTLQSQKPTIDLLFTWQGYNKDETNLHKMFSEKRVRGEWFNLNNKDIDTIKNYFEGTSLNVES
tara:strand:- start:126 stop:830 length:705 start_codon:yes stop_codon:yes gene_type:complete